MEPCWALPGLRAGGMTASILRAVPDVRPETVLAQTMVPVLEPNLVRRLAHFSVDRDGWDHLWLLYRGIPCLPVARDPSAYRGASSADDRIRRKGTMGLYRQDGTRITKAAFPAAALDDLPVQVTEDVYVSEPYGRGDGQPEGSSAFCSTRLGRSSCALPSITCSPQRRSPASAPPKARSRSAPP